MSQSKLSLKDIQEAKERLNPYVCQTPLELSTYFSQTYGSQVFLKHDEMQYTGSFKLRGAFNKLLTNEKKAKESGVITASTGNHGLAASYASKMLEIKTQIYLPQNASSIKVNKMQFYSPEICYVDGDCGFAEKKAREAATEQNKLYMSPYNDEQIMAGQGTVGLEIYQQIQSFKVNVDACFVSVGGGGLISGIATALKELNKNTQIIACFAENDCPLYHSLQKGKMIDIDAKDTLASGLAGNLDFDNVCLNYCSTLLDESILVNKEEIEQSVKEIAEKENCIIEGAAGVAIAAYKKTAEKWKGKNVAIVLCGKNIPFDQWQKIVNKQKS